jgi:aminopeptidase N
MTQVKYPGTLDRLPPIVHLIDAMKTRRLRLLLLALLLVVCSVGEGLCAEGDAGYRLAVRLFPEVRLLEGEAALSIADSRLASGLALRLSPQAELLDVTLDGQPWKYRFAGDELNIAPAPAAAPEPSLLVIHYRVRYADPLPATTVGMENPSFGVSATIGESGAYLSAGTAWFPQPPTPPDRYRIRIAGPVGFYGVTAGKLLEQGSADGQSHTLWETSFPLDGLALAAGYYRIFEEQVADIQLLAFLTEQNAALASTYLDAARKYLQFYQRLLGRYPFAKFAVVENFLPTGYGLPSWTLLGSNVIALPFIPHTSLPHEIVHSWFGNAVEVDYRAGNWAEGLTSYLADYLLKEQHSDEQGRAHRLGLLRDYAALVPPQQDYPLTRFVSRTSKPDQAIGYGKSAMIFHMLRRQIGEEAFWSTLRKLAAEGAGQRLGWNDLQRMFSAVSGRDLTAFFQQWVERPGAPQLRFEEVAVVAGEGGWEVRGAMVQSGPLYRLDVPLRLQTEAGVIEQTVSLRQRRTAFAITTDVPALRLSGDPDAHLFRRLQLDELPATINDLRASRNLLVVVRSARDPLLEASADLLRGLQQQQARVVSWQEFEPAMAGQHDLLFIGRPPTALVSEPELLPLQAEQDSFYWDGSRYQDAMDSLFVCRRTSDNDRRLRALFHPLSDEAARKVARKIPHYGRYSHLVFKNGANLVKGTDEPADSPLRVDLP